MKITIYLAWKAQIALLLVEKLIILVKYANDIKVFSKKLAKVLPKQIGISKYTIDLEKGK